MAQLRVRRHDVLMPSVTRHGGRVFKLMGDGVFIEFGSVVNAVECAVEIQKEMRAKNASKPSKDQLAAGKPGKTCTFRSGPLPGSSDLARLRRQHEFAKPLPAKAGRFLSD